MPDKVWRHGQSRHKADTCPMHDGHIADTWWTQGGHMVDTKRRTVGGPMADAPEKGFKAGRRQAHGGHKAGTWRTRIGDAARAYHGQLFFLRELHSELFGEKKNLGPENLAV